MLNKETKMEIQKEEPISLLFKWIIFHPFTDIYSSTENDIEKYEIYTDNLKIFEFKYDKNNNKYDIWREPVLFELYEEFEILTNVKPDNVQLRKLLQERINDDLVETVIENMRSMPKIHHRRKIR